MLKIRLSGLLLLVLFTLFSKPLIGQENTVIRCYFDEKYEQALLQPGVKDEIRQLEKRYQDWVKDHAMHKHHGAVRTIPVVVHIIKVNSDTLVSDARVHEQIKVLNEDFRKIAGTPGDGDGVDTEIEFCLATIDPNGCPTNGINRVEHGALAFHIQNFEADLKALIQWDPEKYLNIWVPLSLEGGLLGYATTPLLLGAQPQLDGVVVGAGNFGRGLGTPAGSYDQGRTLTHEIGHWLGLFHPFQGGCTGTTPATCTILGDLICDTPPTANANYGCPGPQNTCTETPTDVPDQPENYMDYGDDRCMDMYTQGQSDRMNFFLDNTRDVIWSAANLKATGCDGTVSTQCAPQVDFRAHVLEACPGQSIQFEDLSQGPADTWNWTFTGGIPATSTQQNPVVRYDSVGIYPVSLQVSNSLGQQSETRQGYINVSPAVTPPFSEDFESILFLPQGWFTQNEDKGLTWEAYSNSNGRSMVMKNFQSLPFNHRDDLITFPIDMSRALSASLDFDYAYKRATGFLIDSLHVLVSRDCGTTWTAEWVQGGPLLATVPGISPNAAYEPASGDWKTITVDLTDYLGASDVRIAFRVVGMRGQNLYLDNVNLNAVVNIEDPVRDQGLVVSPNPFRDETKVRYTLVGPASISFALYDINGKMLYQGVQRHFSAGNYVLPLPSEVLQGLRPGAYLLEIRSEAGNLTQKLLKLN